MRAVRTVLHQERVRKFSGYERLVLASIIPAVLIISIFYMGNPPLTAQSSSGGNSNSFKIYIGNATMTNVTMTGPYQYNYTYNSLNMTLNVTRITADVANLSEMLLVKEGSKLELGAPNASATKLIVYTTNMTIWVILNQYKHKITLYGNSPVDLAFPETPLTDAYMEAVYLQAETFSASLLSLICT